MKKAVLCALLLICLIFQGDTLTFANTIAEEEKPSLHKVVQEYLDRLYGNESMQVYFGSMTRDGVEARVYGYMTYLDIKQTPSLPLLGRVERLFRNKNAYRWQATALYTKLVMVNNEIQYSAGKNVRIKLRIKLDREPESLESVRVTMEQSDYEDNEALLMRGLENYSAHHS